MRCSCGRVLLVIAALAAVAVSAGPVNARNAMVTFRVRVPEGTPPDAEVYITGSINALGPWDPGKVELGRIGDRLYAVTIVLPPGLDFRYQITRGSWDTVERTRDYDRRPDRRLSVVGDETVPVEVETWRDFSPLRERHTIVGDLRYHRDFHSEILGNTRNVLVYLPPGYDSEPDARYPVLYMHDGQNLFDAATSFIGVEWNVDETVTRMVEDGEVRPLIIVGVENTSQRAFEYTPVPDRARGGGGGDLYARFLVEEVKPFIDERYRTMSDAAHTGIMGSSFGGLASIYTAWTHPDIFTRVGAMSTSYGWAGGHILGFVETHDPPPGARVWIDMGTAEYPGDANGDGVPDIIEQHRRLRDALLAKGLTLPGTLGYVEDEGAVHNERAWAARFPRALRHLFPAR
jgi:predicted alpha/beta superfamily hydrolase